MAPARLDDLRFSDLSAFLIVQRLGTVTGAARQLGVAPSQVSKAIVRLEEQLGQTLLMRASHGVSLTDAGQRLMPRLDELASRVETLRRGDEAPVPVLSVAAPSFMNDAFLPAIANAAPGLRVRGLDLPPALVRAYASENFFDATLSFGPARLPETWSSTLLGACRSSLFATPALARKLGKSPVHPDALRELPFVSPVYNVNGKFVPVDDGCPIPFGARLAGHEAQTIGLALELARQTNQLVFGPVFAARHQLRRRELVAVRVRGWDVRDPLYLACNVDRVMARMQSAVVQALRARLIDLEK